MWRRSLIVLFFLYWQTACNRPKTEEKGHLSSDNIQSGSNKDRTAADNEAKKPAAFTAEDAETIVARHFSNLNGQAKYPLYKGLLVMIDSISPTNRDTIQFSATINGRQWLTPNGDTATTVFKEKKSFRAFRRENQWQGITEDAKNIP